uniref:Sialate O-acetylesterase domain-containing protein n=1 Tax=viral metagenome TaxID=1070528 RepID=A0A6M3L4B9_9ZZZZ
MQSGKLVVITVLVIIALRGTSFAQSNERWLISGQSNAVSQMYEGSAAEDISDNTITYNYGWRIAQGDIRGIDFVGQWPIHLAKLTGGNVSIINNSVGAKPIDFFMPGGDNYTTGLARVNASGAEIKKIFWFQGESDALNKMGATEYADKLAVIIEGWQADYPGAEIIIILIGYGCGSDNVWIDEIRAGQIEAATAHSLKTIDVSDVKKHTDNCHYSYTGYSEIAELIYDELFHTHKYFFPIVFY